MDFRHLPPPVPSKLGFLGENRLTRRIKQSVSEEYYLVSLAFTAISFRLFQRATQYLVERVDDLPRTPWDGGRNYTVTDINNMVTGYGSLGREVYMAVCVTDTLFLACREISIMLTQFSFWSHVPVQWSPELLFLLTSLIGLSIDLTENISGYIAVTSFPNIPDFWADLLCKANEAKWVFAYTEMAILTIGFIISMYFRIPKYRKVFLEFFYPKWVAEQKAEEEKRRKENGEDVEEEVEKEVVEPKAAKKTATPAKAEGPPRKRHVVKK
ncbi:hypothetical protein SmJEL517_g04002 [Synchytrium microbalum]|uniref:Uncharacterized protein n=1 Tax=Synchytrium microbalum TaxID=1806994 RepID=A0A507C4G1_9FUNG|nr:uncharacterized protein SmJEL517_g04002 [Synchytrium microbalum]TPX33014.1 hypothetical protein SmJEL517_g04002 [Synchytrium microbalum]